MNITCDCIQCELRNAFFNSFEDTELQTFCNQKKEKEYAKGEIIIREGDKIKDFIYLKSGL